MLNTHNFLILLVVASFVAGCASTPAADDVDSQLVDESETDDEANQSASSAENDCALQRAHLEYRQQHTVELPEYSAAIFDVLRRPENQEERVAMMRREWDADWDPDEISDFSVVATPYGPLIAGAAKDIAAVSELSHRLNESERWHSDLMIEEVMNYNGHIVTFILLPIARIEASDDDSCDFSTSETPLELDERWTAADEDELWDWERKRWNAELPIERVEIADYLDALGDEFAAVDSARFRWDGETLHLSLSLYHRGPLARSVDRSPIDTVENGLDLDSYFQAGPYWIPEGNWLDEFSDDPRVTENRGTLESFGELYRETLRHEEQLSAIEAIENEHRARGRAFECLFWAFTGESDDLGEYDFIEARDRWRTRVDSGSPHLMLESIDLTDGSELTVSVSASDTDLVDAFDGELAECLDGQEVQRQRRNEEERHFSDTTIAIDRGKPPGTESNDFRAYSSAEDLIASIAGQTDESNSGLENLQRRLAAFERRAMILEEKVPYSFSMDLLFPRLPNILDAADFDLRSIRVRDLGCTRSKAEIDLTATGLIFTGQADPVSTLLTIYLLTRSTRIVSPIDITLTSSTPQQVALEGIFATYSTEPESPFCTP